MKVLAVDSSACAASAAVLDGEKILSENYLNIGLTHSQTLLPLIDAALKSAGVTMEQIELLAVTNGPGSFTGIRIGVAVIKGLAAAKNIPCLGVSTLEALAWHFQGIPAAVCPVMDARCNQVYNAIFNCEDDNVTRLTEDRAISTADLAQELKSLEKPVFLVGDGAELCYRTFGADIPGVIKAPAHIEYQHASCAALLAQKQFLQSGAVPAAELLPAYLRMPQAERELKNVKINNRRFFMKIALGADHGGYELKESIKKYLDEQGVEYFDFGTHSTESVDYPVIAETLCRSVAAKEYTLGLLFCGTGIGMSMAANKIKGIRAACCSDYFSAKYTRMHNDANVLCLGGRVVGAGLAQELVDVFINTPFEGGRHSRRVDLISNLER